MKNYKNYVAAMTLGVLLASTGSGLTVYANTNTQQNTLNVEDQTEVEGEEAFVLTYEEALEKALKQSYDQKSLMETIDQLEEIRKQAAQGVRFIPYGPQGDELAIRSLFGLRSTEINLQMAKKQEVTLEDMLAFKVRTEYDDIVKKKKEIELQVKMIENVEKQLQQLSRKAGVGTASNYEHQVQLNKYNEENQKKSALEQELDNLYLKLNTTMGIDRTERYDVALEKEVEWMEDVNVDTHAKRMRSQHPSVWSQEQQIRLNELDIQLHVFNSSDSPYEAKESELRKSQIELSSLKENIEQSVKSTYNQMKQLETQYETMKIMLEKAENDRDMAQLRYDVGMGIALDVEMAEMPVTSIKNQMETLLISYEQVRMMFEKPWLVV
ncbi:hypothetical protein Amet_0186 [Alkaliphilus metalliredigens QYMF]|uniref:Outer membrane protein-like protein n=1 Tax=Alkaliphilus metalliredigens (strain QYMF) TaxID=293826 RepID=A6TJQ5_ALKMQ|nr:TolC family protein [Alkaliphilus metalliredigens]ABR46423.1 hypothetical protein Amet_0186 [Alkaliphilus metalliredigens QYMF]